MPRGNPSEMTAASKTMVADPQRQPLNPATWKMSPDNKRAKEPSARIRHVIEPDVECHAVFIGIREHQVGMNRGVDCKQDGKDGKPDHQRNAWIETGAECANQSERAQSAE